MKKVVGEYLRMILAILIGCAVFSVGFNLFLEPHGLNAGGVSGLAMIISEKTKFRSVGVINALCNLPLFILGGWKIGKKFFIGSVIGMLSLSAFIDLFSFLPAIEMDPLVGAIYGGLISGLGLGAIFMSKGSTGGSDIVVRLLKLRYRHVPVGMINICFDAVVAVLTGLTFGNWVLTLYTGICIFISGKVTDAVVYRFDYSQVAIIISSRHEEIVSSIYDKLERGVTYLQGWGAYSGNETKVILTAVKKPQLADLKQLVVDIDPDAFVIVQEAHQVLGDGFSRYTKDSL